MTRDETINKLWDDLKKLKAPEGYFRAGLPRYNTLFGRDSLIAGWQLLGIDPLVAKNTLGVLAKLQGKRLRIKNEEEPGKILHEDVKFLSKEGLRRLPAKMFCGYPYYGSIDSTPLFIIVAALYFEETGDAEFLKEIWPNIMSAVIWLKYFGDRDGDCLIEYQRKNLFGSYHQGWKDSFHFPHKISSPVAVVEVQGYAYLAYKKFCWLSQKLFQKPWPNIETLAENLKRRFNEKFWIGDFFAFCLDGKKQPLRIYTSNPGHLLFTGIIDEKRNNAGESRILQLVKRLISDDLWTPYGIRTLSEKDPCFGADLRVSGPVWPHDNWIIIQGLRKTGYFAYADELEANLIKAFEKIGFMPECYGVKNGEIIPERSACYPQAWSSAALLNLLING